METIREKNMGKKWLWGGQGGTNEEVNRLPRFHRQMEEPKAKREKEPRNATLKKNKTKKKRVKEEARES